MIRRARRLNKTLVMAGLQCRKRAWLKAHESPESGATSAAFALAVGERVQEFAPTYFGPGVHLGAERNMKRALEATLEALSDPEVERIYEATFEADGVLVRADVLERVYNDSSAWDMIEIKSSSDVKLAHQMDLALQVMVALRAGGLRLRKALLANLDGKFELPRANEAISEQARYYGLFKMTELLLPPELPPELPPALSSTQTELGDSEPGVAVNDSPQTQTDSQAAMSQAVEPVGWETDPSQDTVAMFKKINDEIAWLKAHIINDDTPIPTVAMGPHCSNPFDCEFREQCKKEASPAHHVEVPIDILPVEGAKLSRKFAAEGVYDLRELSAEDLKSKPLYLRILQAHTEGKAVRSEEIADTLRKLPWPRYFMDFETVQQVIPVLAGTSPREAIPFQWSVHQWTTPDEVPSLDTGASFLSFNLDDVHRRFADSLLEAVGDSGPIFAHYVPAERSVLKKLWAHPTCQDIESELRAVDARLMCTLDLCKKHFYAPEQRGSFSLKNVVKGIPGSDVHYDDGGAVANGTDAVLAWHDYHSRRNMTDAEREALVADLVRYCAKDTYALVELVRYLSLEDEEFERARTESFSGNPQQAKPACVASP